jgi:hypothetical protein
MRSVACLQAVNTAVITRVLGTLGVRTWTIDIDGVVVSTGLQVERAFRGFNPHHRKVPSYDPILAHLAETTHILRVQNRSGNVHNGKAGLPFLRDLWPQLATRSRSRSLAGSTSNIRSPSFMTGFNQFWQSDERVLQPFELLVNAAVPGST